MSGGLRLIVAALFLQIKPVIPRRLHASTYEHDSRLLFCTLKRPHPVAGVLRGRAWANAGSAAAVLWADELFCCDTPLFLLLMAAHWESNCEPL